MPPKDMVTVKSKTGVIATENIYFLDACARKSVEFFYHAEVKLFVDAICIYIPVWCPQFSD